MARLVPLDVAGEECGAKAATLGQLRRAGFPVPDGVVVVGAVDDDSWAGELRAALHALGPGPYAVRSSALEEDGAGTSFAGQLLTTLGAATPQDVVRDVRRVASSAGTSGLALYADRTGRAAPSAVPVLVQPLVPADAGGVLFTHHPVTGAAHTVIEAAPGTGGDVVGGTVAPQTWVVDGDSVLAAPGPDHEPVLTTSQVCALAETGRRVATLIGCPQDVEWAIADGALWVLQARPITARPGAPGGPAADAGATGPPGARGGPVADVGATGRVLLTGTPSSRGRATGRLRVVRDLDDFHRLDAGDVLVCHATTPAWTPLLARAAAVVTDVGGILSHAAIVAREFGIPAVTDAPDATTVLVDGTRAVVDGDTGHVLAASRPATPKGEHR